MASKLKVCGWCLSAPNIPGGVDEAHARCVVRFGGECDCNAVGHQPTDEIIELMLQSNYWRGSKPEGLRLVRELHR